MSICRCGSVESDLVESVPGEGWCFRCLIVRKGGDGILQEGQPWSCSPVTCSTCVPDTDRQIIATLSLAHTYLEPAGSFWLHHRSNIFHQLADTRTNFACSNSNDHTFGASARRYFRIDTLRRAILGSHMGTLLCAAASHSRVTGEVVSSLQPILEKITLKAGTKYGWSDEIVANRSAAAEGLSITRIHLFMQDTPLCKGEF